MLNRAYSLTRVACDRCACVSSPNTGSRNTMKQFQSIAHWLWSIQFNSKKIFKDLILPGDIQTCEQYNNCSYIYTKQHRFIGQTQANTTYTFRTLPTYI